MSSPFPGMDPYLEGRSIWPDVHNALIVAIRNALAPQVAPRYYVRIEHRTYILEVDREAFVGRPDVAIIRAPSETKPSSGSGTATAVTGVSQTVTLPLFEEVREGYLEIHDAQTHQVITVIEVLSPSNKTTGDGRREYEAKRRQVLHALTNLVEIDLLRIGEPMEMQPLPQSHYRLLIRAGWERETAKLYAFSVRQAIPEVSVPLRQSEPPARLALGELLTDVYDRARYDLSLDYRQPPDPLLAPEDASWADALLHAKGLRQ